MGEITQILLDIEHRWSPDYFPFTHPSFELEVKPKDSDTWMEIAGCGVMEQRLIHSAGVENKMGWAFGIGMERLAMMMYKIPDIRCFWSEDPGFTNQFVTDDIDAKIVYKVGY